MRCLYIRQEGEVASELTDNPEIKKLFELVGDMRIRPRVVYVVSCIIILFVVWSATYTDIVEHLDFGTLFEV